MSAPTISVPHCTGGFCQFNKTRLLTERHLDWKGRGKSDFIHEQYKWFLRTFTKMLKNQLKLINELARLQNTHLFYKSNFLYSCKNILDS